MANKVEFNRDVYYDLAEFIHKRTRWAWLEDPHWCHEVMDAILWSENLTWYNVMSLFILIKDILNYVWKDSYLLDIWLEKNPINHEFNQQILQEQRNYLFKTLTDILEWQWIDEYYWTKILYNCSS